jgi:membrane protease YdiL (CAAX protease family)
VSAVAWALIGAGAAVQLVAWRLVVAGRLGVWVGVGVPTGILGALAVAVGSIHLSPKVALAWAIAVGGASGVALFVATRVFVRIVRAWAAFQRDTAELYGNRTTISLPVALAVALGLSAPGEELFWRGLAGGRLAVAVGSLAAGAAVAWVGYILVLAASESRPIMAGAVVGGGLWSALFVWTGGVVAGIASHVAFTGLMLLLPPPVARARAVGPVEAGRTRRRT